MNTVRDSVLPFIKNRFTAGELAPAFHGQTQLDAYQKGVAEAQNWFVDFRGGLLTRPGTAFANMTKQDDLPIKLFRFPSINPDEADILLIFGNGYIRFMRNGDYLLDNQVTITSITKANPAVVTKTGHGLVDGEWVYLETAGMTQVNQRYFIVDTLTANTFALKDLFGNNINSTAFSTFTSGTFSRVSQVTTPYSASDLFDIKVDPRFNYLSLYHPDYQERVLERLLAPTGTPLTHQWTLSLAPYAVTLTVPGSVVVTPSTAGTASIGYIVTAVDYNGVESLPSDMKINTLCVNIASTAGSIAVTWARVTGARYYNVYRTLIMPQSGDMSKAQQTGFIGRAFGTKLVDNNIIPDFSKSPPLRRRPFQDGVVEIIEITTPGTGYNETTSTVSITTGTGSGFSGYPVVVGGAITAVVIIDGGSGYLDTDTISFGGGGSGAVADITQVSPSGGNNPATAAVFQGRRVYGGTRNSPMTLIGSRPNNEFSNFDVSFLPLSSDSFVFTLDASDIEPIRHLLPVDDALLVFTSNEIRRLVPETGRSVSAVSAATELEVSNIIVSPVPPLSINNDVLLALDKGSAIMALVFNQYTPKRFPQDVSVLSGHLFPPRKQVVAMDWAREPFNLLYVVRDDGTLLYFTYSREQEVYGWCPQRTAGKFRDVCVVQEGLESRPYFVVERFVHGAWHHYIEYGARREPDPVESYFGVDCGITYNGSEVPSAGTLTYNGTDYVFTLDFAGFNSGMVDWRIRGNGGRFTIKEYVSSSVVKLTVQEPSEDMPDPDADVITTERFNVGWRLSEPITVMTGLDHLEGRTVSILADGNVHPQRTVVNGQITLAYPASLIAAGLPYRCVGKTLSLTSQTTMLDGKKKRYVGVAVRLEETRGMKLGTTLDSLYEMKESPLLLGEPIPLQKGVHYLSVSSSAPRDDGLYFVQDNPLPAALLGLVIDAEVL